MTENAAAASRWLNALTEESGPDFDILVSQVPRLISMSQTGIVVTDEIRQAGVVAAQASMRMVGLHKAGGEEQQVQMAKVEAVAAVTRYRNAVAAAEPASPITTMIN